MKRREFIKTTALAGAGTMAISAPAIAKRKRFRWRLAMAILKLYLYRGTSVSAFAKKVKLLSDGQIDIKVYGANELVPSLGTFDAVKSGRIQMGHAASYYWIGKIPASVFFTSVPFGMNANGMRAWLDHEGLDLWRELYKPHGIIPFAAGNTGMQMGGWFNKEIRSIDDFKGLKMRIPGLGGKVIAKAGGKPMLVAGGNIHEPIDRCYRCNGMGRSLS